MTRRFKHHLNVFAWYRNIRIELPGGHAIAHDVHEDLVALDARGEGGGWLVHGVLPLARATMAGI
jgi:hypothetical protein